MEQQTTMAPANTVDPELTAEEMQEVCLMAITEASRLKGIRLAEQEKERQRKQLEAELRRPWNHKELARFVASNAPNTIGTTLVVDEWNKPILSMLAYYFSNDPVFETLEEGFSLDKAIFLLGGYGVGKTDTMKLFSRNKRRCYNVVNSKYISHLYQVDGAGVINLYSTPFHVLVVSRETFYQREMDWVVDDMGTELPKNHMGNKANVIGDIIETTYAKRHQYPDMKLHITSNNTFDEIERDYGGRVRDRIRETHNIIEMRGPSRRK